MTPQERKLIRAKLDQIDSITRMVYRKGTVMIEQGGDLQRCTKDLDQKCQEIKDILEME